MHTMFFSVKRVHWRVVHITGRLLRGKSLTPARFDMMRIVEMYNDEGVAQSTIKYLLGVSAPTVSRMLKSLKELGFVRLGRMEHDKRRGFVELTRAGREVIETALEAIVDVGLPDRMALRGLAFEPTEARPALEKLQGFLSSLRGNYGDPAPFEHPWEVRDLAPGLAW